VVPTIGGSKYFIPFVDEHTRMLWLYTINLKSEALEVFKRFRVLVEKESEKLIKILKIIVSKKAYLMKFPLLAKKERLS
jgi:hypothetical protein